MKASHPGAVSRSVERAMSMFALFAREKRPLSLREIRDALAMPQPSAQVLVRNLAELNYLAQDSETRLWFPTAGFADLGRWLNTALVERGAHGQLVDTLVARTGHTVSIAASAGHVANILYVKLGENVPAIVVPRGVAAPLVQSGVGTALVAALPSPRRAAVLRELARVTIGDTSAFSRRVEETAACYAQGGVCAIYDVLHKGVGLIAAPIPPIGTDDPYVVTIAGISDVLHAREDELKTAVLEAVRTVFPAYGAYA